MGEISGGVGGYHHMKGLVNSDHRLRALALTVTADYVTSDQNFSLLSSPSPHSGFVINSSSKISGTDRTPPGGHTRTYTMCVKLTLDFIWSTRALKDEISKILIHC